MKTTRTTLIAPLALAAMLAACSSTPIDPPKATPTAAPTAPVAAPAAPSAATPNATPQSTVRTVTLPDYLDPKSAISRERSVYFGYDEVALGSTSEALIERHGKYLATNPALRIRVEGNTDERGGTEYNLALGQKRAQAVVKALQIYGVKPTQLEAVSWGEDKPRAQGSDETAWAQNRRADLQYPAQ